jgi:hypothetical protein
MELEVHYCVYKNPSLLPLVLKMAQMNQALILTCYMTHSLLCRGNFPNITNIENMYAYEYV